MAEQVDLFSGTGALSPAPLAPTPDRVIRFGKKYKNQPYEVLLADPSYSLWLLNSMFAKLQEQHPALLTFLLNRFGMPDSTPDHNRLQNRFLDATFALQFALAVSPRIQSLADKLTTLVPIEAWTHHVRSTLTSEHERAERMRRYEKGDSLAKCRDNLLELAERVAFVTYTGRYTDGNWLNAMQVSRLQFEYEGADVFYLVLCEAALAEAPGGSRIQANLDEDVPWKTISTVVSARDGFRIELKPVVGDDYPAILRSMKAVKDTHLLVGEYCGAGATWDEVVRVFSLSGIVAVLVEDVDGTPLSPVYECAAIPGLTSELAHTIVHTAYAEITK